MIRFSLVIKNQKNEYLICECPPLDTEKCRYEFLGGEIATDEPPSFDWLKQKMVHIVHEKVGVDIENICKYELYWHDGSFLWIHAIFTAIIKSGNPQKKFYTKLLWLPINKIDIQTLNEYGLQVYRKIDECSYCHLIRDKKEQLDEFFSSYFSKEEENLAVLETLEATNEGNPIYILNPLKSLFN